MSTPSSPEAEVARIAEIRERVRAATFTVVGRTQDGALEFAASARDDIPWLLSHIAALVAALAEQAAESEGLRTALEWYADQQFSQDEGAHARAALAPSPQAPATTKEQAQALLVRIQASPEFAEHQREAAKMLQSHIDACDRATQITAEDLATRVGSSGAQPAAPAPPQAVPESEEAVSKRVKYAYCKYCGAKLRRDSVGQYCPTTNCQWQHGLPKEDDTPRKPRSSRRR